MTNEETKTPEIEVPTETSSQNPPLESESPRDETKTAPQHRNMLVGGIIAVILLGLGYLVLFTETKFSSYLPFIEEKIATVNGAGITRTEYDNSITSVRATMTSQGLDPDDERSQEIIQSQAVSQLVNAELLIQAATEAGYTADEAAIEEQMKEMEASFGGKEALDAQLAELNITQAMFKEDIREQIIVGAYLEGETDIGATEVTDEEITAFYENVKGQIGEDIPPVEDLREQIIADIQIQKQQGLLGSILAELRANADIQINI